MNHKKTLRIATFLAPNIYPVYQFIADYIGEKLDYPIDMRFVTSHAQYDETGADVSFICGLPYVYFTHRHPCPLELLAAPILIGERYQDKPIYFSDVIVRHDSPHQRFTDLRGGTWAYNEKVSQSGYGITRHHLLQMGATKGFFAKVVNARSHQNAIQLVLKGAIHGTAIDSQVLAVELTQHPEHEDKLRIIDVFGPSSIQPVVADNNLSDALKADIQAVLLAIGNDAAAQDKLAAGWFRRFVKVTDTDYDDIRAMLQQAESANFMTIR